MERVEYPKINLALDRRVRLALEKEVARRREDGYIGSSISSLVREILMDWTKQRWED